MQLFSPQTSVEEVTAEAAPRKFTSEPVEAGEYVMEIPAKSQLQVKTSKAGNKYLSLMLVHTGEGAKGATAVYPSFNLNEVGNSQFRQMLLSLGLSAADVATAQWGATDAAADDKGNLQGVIAINGDSIDIAGRTLSVYLTKKENTFNGKTTLRNEVGRFIIA